MYIIYKKQNDEKVYGRNIESFVKEQNYIKIMLDNPCESITCYLNENTDATCYYEGYNKTHYPVEVVEASCLYLQNMLIY